MIKKIKNKLNGDIHLKDLVKGSAITFVLKMGGMGLSYVLIYLISNQLGAEGVGFYNLMLQILIVLGMVLGLGMNISVLRYVGQFNNEEQGPKMHDLYRHFVRTVASLTALVGILLYFGAEYIVQWTGKDQEYADGLKMVGIVLPFFTINHISVEFIRGLKQLQISELVRSVLRPLVMILGIYFLFWNELSKMDVIYLLVASLILNSLISRWAIWKKLKTIPKQPITFESRELLRTSYPMMITGFSTALLGAMPLLFLDYYTTQTEVGVYSVAFRLAGLVSLVLFVINTIAAPKFSELYWKGETDKLQSIIAQSTRLMALVSIPLFVLLLFFGELILSYFGDSFSKGYYVLIILLTSQLINTLSGSVGLLLDMCGKQKEVRNTLISILPFSALIYYLLVPNYGLLGCGMGWLLCNSIQNITLVIIARRKLGLVSFFTLKYKT